MASDTGYNLALHVHPEGATLHTIEYPNLSTDGVAALVPATDQQRGLPRVSLARSGRGCQAA